MFEVILKTLQRIRRGAGTLPDLGAHPGTVLASGLICGASLTGGWRGLILSGVFVLPVYCQGCYARAVLQEKFDAARFLHKIERNQMFGKFR